MVKRISVLVGVVAIIAAFAAAAQAPDPKLVAKGQTLAVKHKCSMCHLVAGKGGKIGKPLDGVSELRDEAALRRILMNPAKEFPDEKIKMPPVAWAPGEVDAVVAYLKTLKAAPPK